MTPTFASDSDLHGLVDGQIDAERRTQTLRHLAGAPADRSRVESWTAQNELLQRAFAGVDLEPLPLLLDLKAKPKLQSVPANDSVRPLQDVPRSAARRHVLPAAILAFVIIAAAAAAYHLNASEVPTEIAAGAATETAVPGRTSAPATMTRDGLLAGGQGLPTSRIPDLSGLGFGFVSASTTQAPQSIQFTYKGGDESLVINVAKATAGDQHHDRTAQAPEALGGAFMWRHDDLVVALSGSARPARLRALAVALQSRDDL